MYLILPAVLVSLLQLSSVSAHTTFTTLYVDGVNQGDGVCVRMNQDADKASYPIAPLTSKDIACGYDGEKGVSRVCPAKASSTLTFEFREHADGAKPGSIPESHQGPCAVYMKKVDDATADNNAAGDGWFKIWESGFDEKDGKWCAQRIIENNGHLSVNIPADIQAGYYLVRPELLALHAAADNPPDPQFYVGCAQVFVQGSGSANPKGVNIGEGTYDLDTPGMKFNIWESQMKLPYPMFGPPVYNGGAASEVVKEVNSTGSMSQGKNGSVKEATNNNTTDGSLSQDDSVKEALSDTNATGSLNQGKDNFLKQALSGDDNEANWDDDEDDIEEEEEDDYLDDDDDDDDDIEEEEMDLEKRAPMVQTIGLEPEGCILVRDNWCGYEVPSYTTEEGCWASSEKCWDQSDVCWNTAPPTGSKNCKTWQKKCEELDESCRNKNFNGPPNKGKVLTPTPPPLTDSRAVFERDLVRRREIERREVRRKVVYGVDS